MGLLAGAGGAVLLTEVGRERGRQRQQNLWASWGGAPTTRLLRFREATNRTILIRWRKAIEALTGRELPTEEDEAQDPYGADAEYDAAAAYLIEATRDSSRFPLVLAENISYGFRRNLWGLKPFGVTIAAFGAVASGLLVLLAVGVPPDEGWIQALVADPTSVTLSRLTSAAFSVIVTIVWIVVVTRNWVKSAGDAYALRLWSSLDLMDYRTH